MPELNIPDWLETPAEPFIYVLQLEEIGGQVEQEIIVTRAEYMN